MAVRVAEDVAGHVGGQLVAALAAELVRRTCHEQGLPTVIDDPVALRRVAKLLAMPATVRRPRRPGEGGCSQQVPKRGTCKGVSEGWSCCPRAEMSQPRGDRLGMLCARSETAERPSWAWTQAATR